MSDTFEWLPELIKFNDHDGWEEYCEAIYAVFHQDFVASKPTYGVKRFALKRHPEYDGKAATFWHLISEGKVEEERTPDMRRCERIAWPKPIIEAIDEDCVRVWRNRRGRSNRILIAVADFSYVVILDDEKNSYCFGLRTILSTQINVEKWNENTKLGVRRISPKTAEAAPRDGFVTPSTHGR